MGEALAPSACEGNGGGGRFPSQINRRKDPALGRERLGTEEKVPALARCGGPMQPLLNVTNASYSQQSLTFSFTPEQRDKL